MREIEVPATIVVSDLAQKLAIRATDIIKAMMKMGMMVTINQSIDQDTAMLVAEELGHIAKPMGLRQKYPAAGSDHYGSRRSW